MNLFQTLQKKQKTTSFAHSDEMEFYLQNRVLLNDVSLYSPFLKAQDSFDIIRANIIIRALMNKEIIEKSYRNKIKAEKKSNDLATNLDEFMKSAVSDLPFFKAQNGDRIYVPIFTYNLNKIYSGEYEKLSKVPYLTLLKNFDAATIDPFDYYGPSLFNSYFTKLVLIKEEAEGEAFYDFDAESIYFVNSQGRLDAKLCLFDRSLHHPSHNHMLKRISPVVDAYYKSDRESMLRILVDNKLISSKEIYKISNDEAKFFSKINGKGV